MCVCVCVCAWCVSQGIFTSMVSQTGKSSARYLRSLASTARMSQRSGIRTLPPAARGGSFAVRRKGSFDESSFSSVSSNPLFKAESPRFRLGMGSARKAGKGEIEISSEEEGRTSSDGVVGSPRDGGPEDLRTPPQSMVRTTCTHTHTPTHGHMHTHKQPHASTLGLQLLTLGHGHEICMRGRMGSGMYVCKDAMCVFVSTGWCIPHSAQDPAKPFCQPHRPRLPLPHPSQQLTTHRQPCRPQPARRQQPRGGIPRH